MPSLRQTRRELRFGLTDYVQWKTSGDAVFPTVTTTHDGSPAETIASDFPSYVESIYKRNGIVAACMTLRESIFAEVVFRFVGVSNGRTGNLFGGPTLDILDKPFGPASTTGDLAVRMIQDADLAGNFYAVQDRGRLWRRRPDKIAIVLDGNEFEDEFVSIRGYAYYPHGVAAGGPFITYAAQDMCHWTPKPDPMAEYRGMSWLTPVLREIRSDGAATDHKLEFFDNAATPNMVVKTPESVMTREQFEKFREDMQQAHVGRGKRHKTLYLAPGADVSVVGRDFQQMEFSEIQGRDEDRIASAAGVPAVLAGLKESLQGSSLTTGNYAQARRRFADGTMRPLYRSGAGALGQIVRPPNRQSKLWYDDSQISFFREDRRDAADIEAVKAGTIRTLVDAGYNPDSVVAAVNAEDMTLLQHSGLLSVQLLPPGFKAAPAGSEPAPTPAPA